MSAALPSLNLITITAVIISAAILVAAVILYALRRRGFKNGEAAPTSILPDGVGAAEIGCILNGRVSGRDIATLFLQLIFDGNMKIVAGTDPKEAILLQGKKPDKNAARYTVLFWLELFRGRSAIALYDFKELCPSIVRQTKKRIRLKYEGLLHKKGWLMASDALIMAGALLFGAVAAYGLYIGGTRITTSLLRGFAAFLCVYAPALFTIKILGAVKNIKADRGALIKLIISCTVYGAALLILCGLLGNFGVGIEYILRLPLVSCMFTAAAVLIKTPSDYGAEITAHLYSLKAFMETAQYRPSDTRRLFRRQPGYFFQAVPYAYALRAQDAWLPNIRFNAENQSPYVFSEQSGLDFKEVFNRVIEAVCLALR